MYETLPALRPLRWKPFATGSIPQDWSPMVPEAFRIDEGKLVAWLREGFRPAQITIPIPEPGDRSFELSFRVTPEALPWSSWYWVGIHSEVPIALPEDQSCGKDEERIAGIKFYAMNSVVDLISPDPGQARAPGGGATKLKTGSWTEADTSLGKGSEAFRPDPPSSRFAPDWTYSFGGSYRVLISYWAPFREVCVVLRREKEGDAASRRFRLGPDVPAPRYLVVRTQYPDPSKVPLPQPALTSVVLEDLDLRA